VSDPVLHLIAGPKGAGKSTFYDEVLRPATHLEFINADIIAALRWPGAETEHGYEAAQLAASDRSERIQNRRSFATETVFSHKSKVDLLKEATHASYRVTLLWCSCPKRSRWRGWSTGSRTGVRHPGGKGARAFQPPMVTPR